MSARVCPVCGCDGAVLLCRESVPVFLNQTYSTADAARRAGSGRLELAYCPACGLGFNAAFDPSAVTYGGGYENDQSRSPTFGRHIDQMIERVVRAAGSNKGAIVEVGCGQGEFLRRLAARINWNKVPLMGIDPCYRRGEDPTARVRFLTSKLEDIDRRLLPPVAAVLLSRHVIEHIPRPVEFLKRLIDCGLLSDQSRLLLETPSFEWIMRNRMFMDVFYEHCCYFTRAALTAVTDRAGCRLESIEAVFGDQYYWAEARMAGQPELPADRPRTLTAAEVRSFAAAEAAVRTYWLAQIEAAARRGPVAVWGAGAKGVTFATLLDPGRTLLECLIDVNPAKQGRLIPVSGHPIHSVEAACRAGVATAFVMNPNYLDEIRLMAAKGCSLDGADSGPRC